MKKSFPSPNVLLRKSSSKPGKWTQPFFDDGRWLQFYDILSPIIPGASTDNLPPGVLYKVKASYKYQAEDMDELQFEVGEIINVIPYEDEEEQVRRNTQVF